MSPFDHLPAHEHKMAERRCHHRYELTHARKGSVKYVKNLGWARYWKHQIRVQMGKLYKDAHAKGTGGWHKNARGYRYQILGGAYTGKSCVVPLTVKGNKVTGGTPRERLIAAMDAAVHNGNRHSFYSQSGRWDVDHCITGEPWGCRSDCSSWFTSVYKTCGLPDPNGNNFNGGYTGTLGAHGRKITRNQLRPGDAVLFGPFPHHHVEMYRGPGDRTAGHGSPPVDYGVVDLLSGPKTYRSYVP